jgi:hypothetical protein
MPLTAGILIDAPLPRPPQYTLLGAAQAVQAAADEHYLMGVAVRSYPCATPRLWDWRNVTGQKSYATSTPNPTFQGFSVVLAEQCNARGLTPAEYAARVARLFPAVEAFGVEQAFYTGLTITGGAVVNPGLATEIPVPGGADSTIYPTGNTAQTAVEGLAQLEAAIATSGRQGVIHAAPTLVNRWATLGNVLTRVNTNPPTLQTLNGSIVVPGYGYQQLATIFNASTPVPPAGHTAPTGTQEWAYATGPIEVRRTSDVQLIPDANDEDVWMALDRVNNLLAYEATRGYVYDWDACFKAAVKIDRAT